MSLKKTVLSILTATFLFSGNLSAYTFFTGTAEYTKEGIDTLTIATMDWGDGVRGSFEPHWRYQNI